MTISYTLGFVPKWYIADLVGRPLGAGYMAVFDNLNKTQQKLVYQDPAGDFPWPTVTIPNVGSQGILFDENGSQGPFYFEFDSTNTSDLYYIEIYDTDGILQWTIDNYDGGSGGGGGGTVTTENELVNLIANPIFYRNIGSSPSPLPIFLRLCPDNNAGFTDTPSNVGGDTIFYKNNTTALDQIVFNKFTLGEAPLMGDVTPVYYLQYTCTNTPTSETVKNVQFALDTSVQNLSNQPVAITLWAKGNSGTQTLNIQIRQFFGDGAGASPDVFTSFQTLTLTNTWQQYPILNTIPNVSTKVLGACGNDATYLEIGLPLDAACDISFTKPVVIMGSVAPKLTFVTNDQVDSIVNSPRTGDIRTSLNSFAPFGWVPANDGTIGSPTSGATTRANTDTFPLYNLLWNGVADAYAPVTGGRGVSSIADFTANKAIGLTKQLGRAISSVGVPSSGGTATNWALGQTTGEELHILTTPELASHSHSIPKLSVSDSFGTLFGAASGSGLAEVLRGAIDNATNPANQWFTGASNTGATGGNTGHNTIQPTSYLNIFFKL